MFIYSHTIFQKDSLEDLKAASHRHTAEVRQIVTNGVKEAFFRDQKTKQRQDAAAAKKV